MDFLSDWMLWVLIYIGGLIVNLLLFFTLIIRLNTHQGRRNGVFEVLPALVMSIIWPVTWLEIFWSYTIPSRSLEYIRHLLGGTLGSKTSLNWFNELTSK